MQTAAGAPHMQVMALGQPLLQLGQPLQPHMQMMQADTYLRQPQMGMTSSQMASPQMSISSPHAIIGLQMLQPHMSIGAQMPMGQLHMGTHISMGQPPLQMLQLHMRMGQPALQMPAMMPDDSPLSMLAGTASSSPGLFQPSPNAQKRAAEVAMPEGPGACMQQSHGQSSITHKHCRRAAGGMGAGACGWETGRRIS
jgi:hypothetical protein